MTIAMSKRDVEEAEVLRSQGRRGIEAPSLKGSSRRSGVLEGAAVGSRPRRGIDDTLTEGIIGACIEVHRHLGPGLLESVYEQCISHELVLRGLRFERQRPIPLVYKDVRLDCGFRADLVVEECVLVELKTVEELLPVHSAQVHTYLRLAAIDVGLLVNFNVTALRRGLRRLNRHPNILDLPNSTISPLETALRGPADPGGEQ